MPRRELLLSTTLGGAALVWLPRPAAAQVDGIPLYAPSGSAPLPKVGFEKLLPALERRIEDVGERRLAAGRGDWSGVVALVSPEEVAAQGALLGSLAAILGDEAYTVLTFKGKYLASLKKLSESNLVAGTPPSAADRTSRVGQGYRAAKTRAWAKKKMRRLQGLKQPKAQVLRILDAAVGVRLDNMV